MLETLNSSELNECAGFSWNAVEKDAIKRGLEAAGGTAIAGLISGPFDLSATGAAGIGGMVIGAADSIGSQLGWW